MHAIITVEDVRSSICFLYSWQRLEAPELGERFLSESLESILFP
jgi:hypothetical protein